MWPPGSTCLAGIETGTNSHLKLKVRLAKNMSRLWWATLDKQQNKKSLESRGKDSDCTKGHQAGACGGVHLTKCCNSVPWCPKPTRPFTTSSPLLPWCSSSSRSCAGTLCVYTCAWLVAQCSTSKQTVPGLQRICHVLASEKRSKLPHSTQTSNRETFPVRRGVLPGSNSRVSWGSEFLLAMTLRFGPNGRQTFRQSPI